MRPADPDPVRRAHELIVAGRLPPNAEPLSRAATLPAFGVWLSLV